MLDVSQEKDLSSVLPAGTYNVQVEKKKKKNTKSGTGKYWSTAFKVLDESYKGRFVFHNYNTINTNPTAQSIGRSQLKNLAVSAGLDPAKLSPEVVVGSVLSVKVKIQSDDMGERNIVIAHAKSTLNALPKTNSVLESDIPF